MFGQAGGDDGYTAGPGCCGRVGMAGISLEPEGGRGLDAAVPPGPAVSSCTAYNSDWAFQGQLVEAPLPDRFIYGVIES